jgi:D-amino peptidase
MNVLIAADMEGIAGIEDYRACLPSHAPAYAEGRALMTDEVLAVIDALRAGGVERIAVGDWHMVGTNIERDRIPAGVEVRPIADLALAEADPSFTRANGGERLDAVVMIGHHAKTSSPRGFCSHTFIWEMEVHLDGEPLSETQVYAQGLAAEGIPVLVAAGDRWLLEELGDGELGTARLVQTKEGSGRASARSIAPDEARESLADAVAAALAAPQAPPPARAFPAELRISVGDEELATTTVSEPAGLLRSVATIFRESRVSREYRQLARLLPAANSSRWRSARRRLGSLVVTPAIRSKERRWLSSGPQGVAEKPQRERLATDER